MTHIERIQRAIDYIEAHLCDDLMIETIASKAAYSPWHFQRIFGAIVGETVGGYIRRRRLSNALRALRTERTKIADVAWQHGFESHEAFTRAFKATFGITPGEARRGTLPYSRPLFPCSLSHDYLQQHFGGISMEPTIKQLDAITVVGFGSSFISILSPDPERNNFAVIPALWDELFSRVGEIPTRNKHYSLGLCRDLPEGVERTHTDQFYYIAGVPVESVTTVPEGMVTTVVEPATYAVFTHKGKLARLGETMNYIYGSWLPGSEYERANGNIPDLEWYDERFSPESDESELDLYIPLG